MLVYIGGVSGVGKTTTVRKVIEFAQKHNLKMTEAGGISIMCRLANVKTVNELRMVPEYMRRKLRPKMEQELRDIDIQDPETIRMQDGHFVFFDPVGTGNGVREVQPWDKNRILALVVIIASPKIILQCRLQDATERSDRKCDIGSLVKEQELEIKVALSQAKRIGTPLCFIKNEGNEVFKASEMLLGFCIHQMMCRKILHRQMTSY